VKPLIVFLLLCTTLNAQALRSEWRSQYDLGMRPNSRTQSAMDANEDAIESVWSQMKTRKGRIVLGPEGYWIDSPIVSYVLDGQALFGSAGMGLYVSENHFAGGVNSATGGSYSRIVAGADDMAALLDITGYGWRIQDVMFAGNWSQNGSTGWRLAADEPTTAIKIHSNPASVLAANRANPSGPATLFGTGKMIFDGLCFYKLKNGITFGGDNPNTVDGYTEENNADNCHFTRTEGQYLSEAIYRMKTTQAVVFTMGQTHSYYCSEVAYFENGGHADLGFIEVVEGPESGSRDNLGTIVLHLGDPRQNENWYKLHARLDNTAKRTGLKVIQMDSAGFGTIIDCSCSFGYDFTRYGLSRSPAEGGSSNVTTGVVNPTGSSTEGYYYQNTATNREWVYQGGAWAPAAGYVICNDVFDLYGACSVTLRGGPYYSKCLKLRSSGSRYPNVHFPSGTVFQAGITPDYCVNRNTSTGSYKVTWGDCVDVNGVAIPANFTDETP
jgi:hypothetical protein